MAKKIKLELTEKQLNILIEELSYREPDANQNRKDEIWDMCFYFGALTMDEELKDNDFDFDN